MTTAADWRRWAVLSVLAWEAGKPFRTDTVLRAIDRKGWGFLLPSNGRWDAVHRALLGLEKNGQASRSGRPAWWRATGLGQDFAHDFIFGNPNITPERASSELNHDAGADPHGKRR